MDKIFVLYVDISRVREVDIREYVDSVVKKIVPSNLDGTVIIIPTNIGETRFTCINPEYITDNDLIKSHSMLMYELNYELKKQLDTIKI